MKLFSKITLILILTVYNASTYAGDNPGDKIFGLWLTAEKNAKIQIFKTNNSYYGKILWATDLYEPDGKTLKRDSQNEDAAKRGRTIKNLVLLNHFKFEDDIWTEGTIYDPQNGKTYK